MTTSICNNNVVPQADQKLISRLPDKMWQKIFEFSPQQPRLAQVSKAWKAYIEIIRGKFLEQVSVEPNIGAVLNMKPFLNPSYSNSRKVRMLSQFIQAPKIEFPLSFVKQTKKGMSEIFAFACAADIGRAKKLIDMELVSESSIDDCFISALRSEKYSAVELLLPLASNSALSAFNILTIASSSPKIFNLILNSNRKLGVDYALRSTNPDQIKAILLSKRPYNKKFYPNSAMNEPDPLPGLHEALMIAAGMDLIDIVKTFLTYSQPSREILQHVRNRIQFYKDHAHLGKQRLFQIIQTLVPTFIKLENATHRDQILALLDEALARFSESTPVLAPDPAFQIDAERLVPLRQNEPEEAPLRQNEPVLAPLPPRPHNEYPANDLSSSIRGISAVCFAILATCFTMYTYR